MLVALNGNFQDFHKRMDALYISGKKSINRGKYLTYTFYENLNKGIKDIIETNKDIDDWRNNDI